MPIIFLYVSNLKEPSPNCMVQMQFSMVVNKTKTSTSGSDFFVSSGGTPQDMLRMTTGWT